VWADGSTFAFTRWSTGEPNNDDDNEHCIELVGVQGNTPTWNDNDCTRSFEFVCEIRTFVAPAYDFMPPMTWSATLLRGYVNLF